MTDPSPHIIETSLPGEMVGAAATRLRAGELVAFPTETVYGLGANACDGRAVARIFETKGRPSFNPLIVHVGGREVAERHVSFTSDAEKLVAAFWPGPLTLVLRAQSGTPISGLVTAGLETMAVRVPAHPLARDLLKAFGGPIAAPSANRSGRVSPTRAEHVQQEFGAAVPLVLDGGACEGGLESTIVDVSGKEPVLLRPGTISRDDLEAALGKPVVVAGAIEGEKPTAPGQLSSHYAPSIPVRLNADAAQDGEALLGFGAEMPKMQGFSFNLSPSGDLREAAANLFDALRKLDTPAVSGIAVMRIPADGIGEAINDRLQRAAAPRST